MNDVLIIGAGPAGITAAIYALRAGLRVSVCEKNIYGGQTSIIDKIENYPGFTEISGADFSNALYEQASKLGAKFVFSEVTDVVFDKNEKYAVTSSGEKIFAKTVIIANGLKRRLLNCKGEKEFSGKGVSYCATCDGAFFKGKNVVVVGGGNTALEDALYLSNICKKVTMIVRKSFFRGEKVLAQAVNNTSNIEIMFESTVKEISGENFVQSATVLSGEKSLKIDADAVFVAIGYEPDNKIYRDKINMNEQGYFTSPETCETNIEGVYAAGDCRIKPLRQIVSAAADGAVAASRAASFILTKKS